MALDSDEYAIIDQNQWLPRGSPLITPERHAKGDIEATFDESGSIRHAQLLVQNVLNWLWRNEHITNQQHHDAQTYEVWQLIFRARTGYRNNRVYRPELTDMVRYLTNDELPKDDFTKLIRRLGINHCRRIELAIYGLETSHAWLVRRDLQLYKESFELLTSHMKDIRENYKLRNQENNACND